MECKLRIVGFLINEDFPFYVQRKTLNGWETLSRYHRGHTDPHAYLFLGAFNPACLVKYALPEIQKEYHNKNVPEDLKEEFKRLRPAELKLPSLIGITNIEMVQEIMKTMKNNPEYKIPDISEPFSWEWKELK